MNFRIAQAYHGNQCCVGTMKSIIEIHNLSLLVIFFFLWIVYVPFFLAAKTSLYTNKQPDDIHVCL
jgi:hypothetical protein